MVKTKGHSVKFDADERNSFLKQFCGKRKSKDKLKKKKVVKKGKIERKERVQVEVKEKVKKMVEYEDMDKLNDVKVVVTTTTFEE